MDSIKFHGLGSLFDPRFTSEIKLELLRPNTIHKSTGTFDNVTNMVNELNHSLSQLNTTLHFRVDTESDAIYVAMIDTKTDETVRRFPIKEMPNFLTISNP